MNSLFLAVLNMSLTGAFVIASVCLARLLLKKAPKSISYCLWLVVAIRLIMPFSFESVWGLIPFGAQPIAPSANVQVIPAYSPAVSENAPLVLPPGTPIVVPAAPVTFVVTETIRTIYSPPPRTWAWYEIAAYIWLLGAAVMVTYGVVSYNILKRKMRDAELIDENIYRADNIKSPFVLGFLAPKIYLPAELPQQDRAHIILHEQIHIRRFDHVVKFAAYLILCVHWFNPLAWLAFRLAGADMEMSCDERVLREMEISKTDYSTSIVSLATETGVASPLAFGGGSVKERVKNVLNFKKRHRIITVIAVLLVTVFSAGLMLNQAGARTYYGFEEITSQNPRLEPDAAWNIGSVPGYVMGNAPSSGGFEPGTALNRGEIPGSYRSVFSIDTDSATGFVTSHHQGLRQTIRINMPEIYTSNEMMGAPIFLSVDIPPIRAGDTVTIETSTESHVTAFVGFSQERGINIEGQTIFIAGAPGGRSDTFTITGDVEYQYMFVAMHYSGAESISTYLTGTVIIERQSLPPVPETTTTEAITFSEALQILANYLDIAPYNKSFRNFMSRQNGGVWEISFMHPSPTPTIAASAEIDRITGEILALSVTDLIYSPVPMPLPTPVRPERPTTAQVTVTSNEEFLYAQEMLHELSRELNALSGEMIAMGVEMGRLGMRLAFAEMEALGDEMEDLGDVMNDIGDVMTAWGDAMMDFADTHPITSYAARRIALDYAGLTSSNSVSMNTVVVNDRLVRQFRFFNSSIAINVDAITGEVWSDGN